MEKNEYDKAYYQAHKEEKKAKALVRGKQYYEDNKEARLNYTKIYYENNKEGKRQYGIQYQKMRKQERIDYLSTIYELKCSVCGYDKNFSALDFHHLDPDQKVDHKDCMGEWMRKNSFEYFKSKVNSTKMVVLCKNCHAEYHSGVITL